MVKSSFLRRKKQRHEVNNKSENKTKNLRGHGRYLISVVPVRPQEKRSSFYVKPGDKYSCYCPLND
jgi:hypothetical protein